MLIVEHIEDQAGDEEGESVDYANSHATMREPFPHKPTDTTDEQVCPYYY